MGMFDEIICNAQLPGNPPAFVVADYRFQTKTFDCVGTTYVIASDGRLLEHERPIDFHGNIEFGNCNIAASAGHAVYTLNGEDAESVEYVAEMDHGRLVRITLVSHEVQAALPVGRIQSGIYRPSPEEIAERKRRNCESLIGRKLYVMWGGNLTPGYEVEVVSESSKELVARKADGSFEILDRRLRDSTYFDSQADAEESREAEKAKWDRRMDEYDAYAALWKLNRGAK